MRTAQDWLELYNNQPILFKAFPTLGNEALFPCYRAYFASSYLPSLRRQVALPASIELPHQSGNQLTVFSGDISGFVWVPIVVE